MDIQIGFSRSQSQLGTAGLPPHCPTWNATLAVANPWQPHGGRDGGRHGGAIAIPWLAEDILFKYFHGGRMEGYSNSLACRGHSFQVLPWRPHGGRRGGLMAAAMAVGIAAAMAPSLWPPWRLPWRPQGGRHMESRLATAHGSESER